MKKLKLIYIFLLVVFISFLVINLDISIIAKVGICFLVSILPIIYKLFSLISSYYNDAEMDILLKAMVDNLPQSELKTILFEIVKTYDHTWSGLSKVIDNISEYACANFSDENIHKLGLAFKYMAENIDKGKRLNPLKIYRAFKTSNDDLYYRYISEFVPDLSAKRIIIEFFVTIVYLFFSFLWIIYLIFPNYFHFILIPISLILNCILSKPLSKIISASYLDSVFIWLGTIFVSLRAVFQISYIDFHRHGNYYTFMFIFLLISVIISGIWITNKLWTCTEIEEKNKGSFISNRNLLSVIHTKFISKTRWVWLWVTFIVIIVYIICFFL